MRLGCENALSMQIGVWAANWRSAANWRFGLQMGVWAATGVLAANKRSNLFENRPFGLSGAAHLMLP